MIEKNPKYDGLYVFKIDISKLMAGDVLLTRNAETTSLKGSIQSNAIMKISRGNFSHALLCTVPPTFIEAVGQGVSNLSMQSCFAHDLKNVRILRYGDPLIAKNAGRMALPMLGQEYSLRNAIGSILPSAKLASVPDNKLFCSALVAAAFRKAGAKEFEDSDPMKITPATLEKASYFTDVTNDLFIRILSPENIEYMSALDGDRVASPLGGQAKLFQEYYGVLSPMIGELIGTMPELSFGEMPGNFFECLMFITDANDESDKYPDVVAVELKRQISLIDVTAYKLLTDGRLERMQKNATENDERNIIYTIEQSFRANPDIDIEDARSLISATRKQIISRSELLRDERMEEACSTRRWLEITREVISVLKYRLVSLEESFQRAFPGEEY